MLREVKVTHCDLSVYFIRINVIEWRIACEHFENENTKSPPINSLVMSTAHYDLWCYVLRGTTQREAPVCDLLGKSKVCDLQVSITSNQKILWLQVSVSYALRVHVLECKQNLCSVEKSHVVGEVLLAPQESENLTTLHKLKAHE